MLYISPRKMKLVQNHISVPNGIGASDYNITSLLLDADGIDPLKDVTLTQVSSDACIAAMERGEISDRKSTRLNSSH